MNNIKFLLLILLFALVTVSCGGGGGGDDDPTSPPQTETPDTPTVPEEPEYPTFETPQWDISNYYEYEYSMTAIISISTDANIDESENDKLAVFCSTECRGVAERIEIEKGNYVWIILIYGTNSEEALTFSYYSSKNKHLYKSTSHIKFKADDHIGYIDEPQNLNFEIVTSGY